MIEFFNNLVTYFTDMGVSRGVAIAYILILVLIVVMAIAALVMRIIVLIKYQEANHTTTSSGKNSLEVAKEALQKAGLGHIKVKRAGFFRAFFIGNCYSITQKTIYLRGGIANKNSITAVGMALQKVGVAKLCESGDKTAKTRNVAQILSLVGPILFIPVVLVFSLLDFLFFETFGMFSIIGIIVGAALLISGFVSTMLTIPVEKKANDMAMEMIQETGVLNENEQRIIKKVFDAYIVTYVCEFIISVLRVVQIVLEIVMNQQITANRNNNR